MPKSFSIAPAWRQIGDALPVLPLPPGDAAPCFPPATQWHAYIADPQASGMLICRHCATRKPHPRRDPALTGQQAYEADCVLQPTYQDGAPRPAWADLPEWAQWSWGRAPLA